MVEQEWIGGFRHLFRKYAAILISTQPLVLESFDKYAASMLFALKLLHFKTKGRKFVISIVCTNYATSQ